MKLLKDKTFLGFLTNMLLTYLSLQVVSLLSGISCLFSFFIVIFGVRMMFSILFFYDYKISWSRASIRIIRIKFLLGIFSFVVYAPFLIYFKNAAFNYLFTELIVFLLFQIIAVSFYQYKIHQKQGNCKKVIIYGAGNCGSRFISEYSNSNNRIIYFVDENKDLQNRSIDGISIIKPLKLRIFLKDVSDYNNKIDLLIIAIPSASQKRRKEIYLEYYKYFKKIKIVSPLARFSENTPMKSMLKDIPLEQLLLRAQNEYDEKAISSFIKNKVILITGAGGSIGSELSRKCMDYQAEKLILLDNSEFNLYSISEELKSNKVIPCLITVTDKSQLETVFKKYKPEIVLHAAAYKHVPLLEINHKSAIVNNIQGTMNCIDLAIEHKVNKFVLISTDKAVNPTNIMGATKRICELYATNVKSDYTEVVTVRFGNVLGSSGSVVPKFKEQIMNGGPILVTHPEIIRYFMLIPEACQLVLQAASLGNGREIFILDMGKPVKIVDLAKRMIELSGCDDIEIEFTGLRKGEKLYEELLTDGAEKKTKYDSITVSKETHCNVDLLRKQIHELIEHEDKIVKIAEIFPEFFHNDLIKKKQII
ncbi:MAG: polysaccharide biosynthesis protein [Candidatus Cloacimonetes bacterium]|nr:polysaccharide biosynthesis protein [Candidatus Cloacimonadota bacterium]